MREGGALVVIGTSGAGKSSLLRAGVLPAIEQGKLPAAGSGHWPQLVVTPSADPVMALATAVGAVMGKDPQDLRDPRQCVRAFRQLPTAGPRQDPVAPARVVLVVEPLEDLFTACSDKQRRRQFIDVLDQLSAPGDDGEDPAALVIVGLRADYYQALADYPHFWHALGAPVPVSPMSAAEVRDAIRLPAADVSLEIEDGLVEVLLADLGVGGDGAPGPLDEAAAGRLALLAHALRTTWQQRHGDVLTVDGYRATGGIRKPIAKDADQLFGSLSGPGQQVARTLFLRLVKIAEKTDDARRHVKRGDLLRGLPDPGLAGQVADAFIRGRLLTQEQDTIAITHDALMRAWPQLSRWIAEDRDCHLIRQGLDEAAASWSASARPESEALYRGNRLDAARSWGSTHPGDLSRTAREFLTASRAQQRRGARLRRGAVAALAVLALGRRIESQSKCSSRGCAGRTVRQLRDVAVPLLGRREVAACAGADLPGDAGGIQVPQPGHAAGGDHGCWADELQAAAVAAAVGDRLADRGRVGGVGDVPQPDRVVVACAGRGAAVRAEGHLVDPGGVPGEHGQRRGVIGDAHVPQPDGVVKAAAGQGAAVGAVGD